MPQYSHQKKAHNGSLWLQAALTITSVIACVVAILLVSWPSNPTDTIPAFYGLVDEIQTAKETYADAHGIPRDATLTEWQIEGILAQFYPDHPRNAEGNFLSPDLREFIKVPRQVNQRPEWSF